MVEEKDQQKNQTKLELENKGNIKEKDLELSLRENTSLTDKQIQEIVPILLEVVKKLQSCEEQASAEATGKNLKELKQTVANGPVTNNAQNNQNVEIDLKNNYGKVIGAVTYNKQTNNYYITINQPKQETPKQEVPKPAPKQETPKQEVPKPAPRQEQLVQNNTSMDNRAELYTVVGFLSELEKLLLDIEDTEKGIGTKYLLEAGKLGMKNAKKKLEQYKKQVKGKIEGLKKQPRTKIYDSDIAHLDQLKGYLEDVREEISGSQWSENPSSGTKGFLYNSPENAEIANKQKLSSVEFNKRLQEVLKQGAILNIFNQDLQKATDFYRRYAEGVYTPEDEIIRKNNATNYEFMRSFQYLGIQISTGPMYIQRDLKGTEYTSGASRGSVDYSNMDYLEAHNKGGIPGVLDKFLSDCTNMTQSQKNTWKNVGVLGCIAGAIYCGYKFFTSKSLNKWEKAGITGLALFLPNAIGGVSLFDLIGKLFKGGWKREDIESRFGGNVFGNAVNGIGNSGIDASQTVVPSMYSMMVFNPETTVGDVRNLTTRFKTNGNEWIAFRQEAIDRLRAGNYGNACIDSFSNTFSNNFDEQKWNAWLASVGITDSTNSRRTLHELAMNSTFNETALTKFKSDNGLKETDVSTKKKELQDYIKSRKQANQAIDLAVLEAHKNDWFKIDSKLSYTERDEDRQNKEKLISQVEALSIDSQNKGQLNQAIQTFYDERTLEAKPNLSDFSLKMENGLLVLKSHSGQETKIDLNKKEIVGFGNGITFTSLSNLLNVADLSNKILESQRGKVAVSYPPFEYKTFGKKGRGVYFNDAETLSFNFDTRVLSSGRGGVMGKIDPLGNYPEEYAKYLSQRWMEINKPTSK